jgi:hypothetical protein
MGQSEDTFASGAKEEMDDIRLIRHAVRTYFRNIYKMSAAVEKRRKINIAGWGRGWGDIRLIYTMVQIFYFSEFVYYKVSLG